MVWPDARDKEKTPPVLTQETFAWHTESFSKRLFLKTMYSILQSGYINIPPTRLLRIWKTPHILLREAKDIKMLDIIKRDKNLIYSAWAVDIEGVLLQWRQVDELNLDRGIISFRKYGGEAFRYEGMWQIVPARGKCTRLFLTATVEWGIPVLAPYVEPVLERKSKVLLRSFFQSVKNVAEKKAR